MGDIEIVASPQSTEDLQSSGKHSWLESLRHLSITLLSAAFPGVGHLLFGELPKGMILFAAFAGLLCCFWPLRLLHYYAGFVLLYASWIFLGIYSPCSTQMIDKPHSRTRVSNWWFAVTIPLSLVIVSLLGRAVTRASGFRAFQVPSTSMEPTIHRGDRLVADMRAFNGHAPQYRDVVVFYRDGTYFIKRVVAIGGDTIEGKNGGIIINGSFVNESYIEHSLAGSIVDWQTLGTDPMQNFGPLTVPPGEYFVLGDNRDVSLDSRAPLVGFIDRSSMVGKVLYVFSTARDGAKVR